MTTKITSTSNAAMVYQYLGHLRNYKVTFHMQLPLPVQLSIMMHSPMRRLTLLHILQVIPCNKNEVAITEIMSLDDRFTTLH